MLRFGFRRFLAFLLCCLLCLLLVPSSGTAGKLHGKVKKKTYYSPLKNFSVPVPAAMFGRMKVSDHYQAEDQGAVGSVSFHGDMGELEGILYMKTPTGFVPSAANWRLWLHDVALPGWFLPASADSRVLKEEPMTFEGFNGYRALVEVPGGSPLMDKISGRRLDSRRGLIAFERGCCLYALMTETLNIVQMTKGELKPLDANWASFAAGLQSFYGTIRFQD